MKTIPLTGKKCRSPRFTPVALLELEGDVPEEGKRLFPYILVYQDGRGFDLSTSLTKELRSGSMRDSEIDLVDESPRYRPYNADDELPYGWLARYVRTPEEVRTINRRSGNCLLASEWVFRLDDPAVPEMVEISISGHGDWRPCGVLLGPPDSPDRI